MKNTSAGRALILDKLLFEKSWGPKIIKRQPSKIIENASKHGLAMGVARPLVGLNSSNLGIMEDPRCMGRPGFFHGFPMVFARFSLVYTIFRPIL
jgi:hypothetical protein